MKFQIAALIMTVCVVSNGFAGELRYIVPTRTAGIEISQFPLWTDRTWPDSCFRATLRGTQADQKMFCEDGFSGLKPKKGTLAIGTEVELLDSRECGSLAYVRVLSGPIAGETGCISANALSSINPQMQSAPVLPQSESTRSPATSGKTGGGQITAPRQEPSPARLGSSTTPVELINRAGSIFSCPPAKSDSTGVNTCVTNAESQGFVRMPEVSAGLSLDWNSKPVKIIRVSGAAAEAGLRAGDLLLDLDGNKIEEAISIFRVVGKKQPGDHIIVKIARGRTLMNFTYSLTARRVDF